MVWFESRLWTDIELNSIPNNKLFCYLMYIIIPANKTNKLICLYLMSVILGVIWKAVYQLILTI